MFDLYVPTQGVSWTLVHSNISPSGPDCSVRIYTRLIGTILSRTAAQALFDPLFNVIKRSKWHEV